MANAARGRAARHFDDPAFASRYEAWYEGPGRRPARLEKSLLHKLLGGFEGASSALEVVRTITGIRLNFSSDFNSWSTSLPSFRGRFRSSMMISGRGEFA